MSFKFVHFEEHLYFITATINGWVRLFDKEAYRDIILKSLEWHSQNKRWLLYAFVVMPNHLHAIIKPIAPHTISMVIQSFCSFTSHAILKRLRADGAGELLNFFKSCQHDVSKAHKIWKDSQAKNIFSSEFLRQKLEYIHNNPVAKDWHLSINRSEYPWSSAGFYDLNRTCVISVADVSELF